MLNNGIRVDDLGICDQFRKDFSLSFCWEAYESRVRNNAKCNQLLALKLFRKHLGLALSVIDLLDYIFFAPREA